MEGRVKREGTRLERVIIHRILVIGQEARRSEWPDRDPALIQAKLKKRVHVSRE